MKKQILAVSSFKGGTAKTSTSLHLGAAFAKFHKKKVLLVDFDAQANLSMGLGFDPDAVDSMAPVLLGKKEIKEVIQKTCVPNLDIVPADTWLERVEVTGALAADRYSHERLKQILDTVNYDYIIIDTPPSLCWLTESALIAANHAVVCATCEFYSVKGLERLSDFMNTIAERHPMAILGVIISFWNARAKNNGGFLKIIEKSFPGGCFNTKVRRDVSVSAATVYGKPIFEVDKLDKASRASEDFKNLAKEIVQRLKQ
ncbi:MAG: ParA family protein [Verrucomicrobia bacterium]|nr:ParA family protein [Verrucomicrobiota bacterium]MBS0636457.1 ParA family protein [Verrucomicrobiota bacterium]